MEGGRKRRSEMSAPIPIAKESVRADSERQSNMVTLRRGGNKAGPSSSAGDRGSQANKSDDKRKDKPGDSRGSADQVNISSALIG